MYCKLHHQSVYIDKCPTPFQSHHVEFCWKCYFSCNSLLRKALDERRMQGWPMFMQDLGVKVWMKGWKASRENTWCAKKQLAISIQFWSGASVTFMWDVGYTTFDMFPLMWGEFSLPRVCGHCQYTGVKFNPPKSYRLQKWLDVLVPHVRMKQRIKRCMITLPCFNGSAGTI